MGVRKYVRDKRGRFARTRAGRKATRIDRKIRLRGELQREYVKNTLDRGTAKDRARFAGKQRQLRAKRDHYRNLSRTPAERERLANRRATRGARALLDADTYELGKGTALPPKRRKAAANLVRRSRG